MLVKQSRNFYLSEETLEMVRYLSGRLNLSQAQVVEEAVRILATEKAREDFETLKRFVSGLDEETKAMLVRLAGETRG